MWCEGVSFTLEEPSTESHTLAFLDVDVAVDHDRGGFRYSTHRKPLNQYLFTPFSSCHSSKTFRAIVVGELKRACRTCSSKSAYVEASDFIVEKFRCRGYPEKLLERCKNQVEYRTNSVVAASSPALVAACSSRVVPYRIQYFEGAEHVPISRLFGTHSACLDKLDNSKFRAITCFRSGANLFRSRYARFFKHACLI